MAEIWPTQLTGYTWYRPRVPDQSQLLPPSRREWLPEGRLVEFLLDDPVESDLHQIEKASRPRVLGERGRALRE